jgi:hypothetical protein
MGLLTFSQGFRICNSKRDVDPTTRLLVVRFLAQFISPLMIFPVLFPLPHP